MPADRLRTESAGSIGSPDSYFKQNFAADESYISSGEKAPKVLQTKLSQARIRISSSQHSEQQAILDDSKLLKEMDTADIGGLEGSLDGLSSKQPWRTGIAKPKTPTPPKADLF